MNLLYDWRSRIRGFANCLSAIVLIVTLLAIYSPFVAKDAYGEVTGARQGAGSRGASTSQALPNDKSASVSRMVLAKTPIPVVFKRASTLGLSHYETVLAVISSGASPGLTVYFSVTEGYDLVETVDAAIERSVSLERIVASALSGGAKPDELIRVLTEVGVSPEGVADLVVNATTQKSVLPKLR